MADNDPFRARLHEVAEHLVQEHNREVQMLYHDNLNIRQELARVASMMQEFLQREEHLKQVLQTLTDAHTSFGQGLQSKVAEVVAHGDRVGGSARQHHSDTVATMTNTANELQRIQKILSVPPTQPPGTSPYPVDMQTQPQGMPAGTIQPMGQSPPPPVYMSPSPRQGTPIGINTSPTGHVMAPRDIFNGSARQRSSESASAMNDAASELARIQGILAAPPVRPPGPQMVQAPQRFPQEQMHSHMMPPGTIQHMPPGHVMMLGGATPPVPVPVLSVGRTQPMNAAMYGDGRANFIGIDTTGDGRANYTIQA